MQTTGNNLRSGEDQKFLAELNGKIESINMGRLDAPLRTGKGIRGIVLETTPPPSDDPESSELADDLLPIVKTGALFVPLAAALHLDHFVAREAALSLCTAKPFAIYEDIPYVAHLKELDIREKVQQLSDRMKTRLHPVLLGRNHSLELKRRCISCYSSQITERTIRQALDFSNRYDRAERLWATAEIVEELIKVNASMTWGDALCRNQ